MDTATTTRPEFRDHHNQDNSVSYQHSYPSHTSQQQQQHYTHTTPFSQPLPPSSSTLQPYLPSSHLPQPFSRNQHDSLQRHTTAPLPSQTTPLTTSTFTPSDPLRQSTLPQPPQSSQPTTSLYQPQFKPIPHPEPSFPDSHTKHTHQTSRNPLHTSLPKTTHTTPLPRHSSLQQHHHDRYSSTQPQSSSFPSSSAPLSSLENKSHSFPYTKSLPYPLAPPHPSKQTTNLTQPSTTQQPTSTPTPTPAPTQPASHNPAPSSPARPPNLIPQQEHGPLYDIAKLLSAHCTILSGKVYNDKGHNICGVLNQHDKPCKRIGKCPFHGDHKPVTAENSINGTIDASGTVATPSTSPDGTTSPTGRPAPSFNSPGASDNTAVNSSKPKIPPKQQYKHGWSKEEHFLFLGGLSQHGKGSWKQIASVVKTRTPTQVQSHAQKYFQRQKQTDKNKRSIHDLSLDSPEMIEVAKKLKTSGTRLALPAPALGEPIAMTNVADGGALRTHGVSITPPALTLNHTTLPTDNVGRGMLNETGLARFGANVQSSLDSKFGHVQATSATTLGSLNSGVQIPGAPHNRPFPATQTNVGQPELFGQLHQGTIHSAQDRRHADNRLPMKMDGTPGRDVILNSVRPAFMQDPYQGNTNTTLLPGQQLLGAKQSLYGNQSRTAGLSGNETATTADHGQAAYNANALQGLYRQIGGGSNVFPQARGGNETQLQWGYDNDGKPRRQREVNTTNRDFHLQNTQLSTTLHGIGQIPLTDHLGGATGIANEHTVDQPFDGSHQNQGTAFASGIFGGNESVEVDTNVYGVGGGQANAVQVPGRLGTGVSGYPQSSGVHMGQMPLQTAFGSGTGAYHRND